MTGATAADRFLERVTDWARGRSDVLGLLLVGSRARTDTPADEWSDVDLVLIVDDAGPYISDSAWLTDLGTPVATFVEDTIAGQRERRVLFDDGLDVDFPVLPWAAAESFLREQIGPIGTVIRRGARVLFDRDGRLTERVGSLSGSTIPAAEPPDQATLDQLANDVWYHLLWAARKHRRGELWVAVECCDAYLKDRLLQALRWRAQAESGTDTWHGGRFLERWLDPSTLARLPATFAGYEADRLPGALLATGALFRDVARDLARRLDLAYPEDVDAAVSALLESMLDPLQDPRS